MNILELNNKAYKNYKGKKLVVGFSEFSRPILCYCVQKSEYPKIIVQASMHAREYITAYLTLKLLNDFYRKGKNGSVYFIPIVNPDGVRIALNENPLYKANGRKVDLNTNFDARWGTGQSNITTPSTENYIGEAPFSEKESRALRDFTLKVKPDFTISYHSKGQEIYYDFFQDKLRRQKDLLVATKIAKETGYKIVSGLNSSGGYKDWCIEELKIPSVTIEVGRDNLSHPIKKDKLAQIYKENKKVILVAIEHFLENNARKIHEVGYFRGQKSDRKR